MDAMIYSQDGNSPNKMRYKDFVWENNPRECHSLNAKRYAKHNYLDMDASEIEEMGLDSCVITGTGEFFGEGAYDKWLELFKIFSEPYPGRFYHPMFLNVTCASFTKLEPTIQPVENYVQYTFEFVEHRETIIKDATTKDYYYIGDTGDMVTKIQKYLKDHKYNADVTGKYSHKTANAVRKFQKDNGIKITGKCDDHTLRIMNLTKTSESNKKAYPDPKKSSSSDKVIVYTVKSGDVLWRICRKYKVDWKQIAKYNHLRNPHLIFPGQKIKILIK